MALTCGFYNSIYGDRKYSAIQLSSIFDGIIKDGIFATVGDAFTVSAGSEMQVIVGPGRAWFNHSWTLNDANLPIEVDDAEVVLDRIDAVVIEVNSDDSVRDNTVKMVKGRPSSTPEKPELLDTETVHQYALAYVTVRSGVTEITNADIENAVGTTETPFITGLLETIDATELMNQWNGQFQDWLNEADDSLDNWETQSTALMAQWTVEFEDWFEHLQNELDENQAAHLQHQIDELRVKSGMSAKILINSDPGSTVTVTKPDGTVVVATQVLGTTTQWECSTGDYGVHYIHSVLNGEDAHVSLNVDTCKIYTIDDVHMHADITVTFPSGFACRCQGGSENLYATSNPFTFVVHNKTTYTITASAPGITYTETVEITTSGQTESIFCPSIENAPTDDVQMWLYFGGIFDKSYTTLSEVLSDTTTLSTLIADNNAVDYMVRSKSWASNKGLVPVMTSNTTPSGVASADSEYSSSYAAYKSFDGDTSSYWSPTNGTTTKWLQYMFANEMHIVKWSCIWDTFDLTSIRNSISSVTLQGSNDGFVSDINNIDTVNTANMTSNSLIRTVNADYTYFRISFDKIANANATPSRVQFYAYDGNGITEDSTAMTYIGLNNYCANTLLADTDWLNAICNSAYIESVLNVKVPTMTSNTTPSGTCFGSTIRGSNDYYKSFNDVDNDGWQCATSDSFSTANVGYEFATSQVIKCLMLNTDEYSGGNRVTSFQLQGSDDRNSWSDIGSTESRPSTTARCITKTPYLNNTPYKALRVRFLNGVGITYLNVSEIQFYGRVDV